MLALLVRKESFEQSGALSGNSSLDCEALSELSHVTGECREVSALAARGDAEGPPSRGILCSETRLYRIIMQSAVVSGTGLLLAKERRGWGTMIFVSIRFAAQDRSDHENG